MPKLIRNQLHNLFFAWQLLPNVCRDMWRYYRYSGVNKNRHYLGEQAARIAMDCHKLEQGLSYQQPEPGFGEDIAQRLLATVEEFVRKFGFIHPATTALGVLGAYVAFNESARVDMDNLKTRIIGLSREGHNLLDYYREGGVIPVSTTDLAIKREAGFKEFFNSRHSIRSFSGYPIPDEDITEAINIARKTPSACNRQAWKVHIYAKDGDIEQLLAIQKNKHNFCAQASVVLLITCDLTHFVDVSERYQAWVDGGMFSMSLSLAFHSLGYGTCCLNWSSEQAGERALRKVANIAEHEQIIMMIAVGTLPEHFNVSYSARKPLAEVMQVH